MVDTFTANGNAIFGRQAIAVQLGAGTDPGSRGFREVAENGAANVLGRGGSLPEQDMDQANQTALYVSEQWMPQCFDSKLKQVLPTFLYFDNPVGFASSTPRSSGSR